MSILPSAVPASMTAAIRLAASVGLKDTATIKRFVEPTGTGPTDHLDAQYGDYDDEHASSEYSTRCGFKSKASEESGGGYEEATEGRGMFKIPFDNEANIDNRDRIVLTHVGGIALEQERTYEFTGPLIAKLASLVGPVRLVTGGAESGGV